MRTMGGRSRTLALLVAVTAALGAQSGALAGHDAFPSTNDRNRDGGRPHVDEVDVGIGSVTLRFTNSTVSLAFFEYRIDGEVLTSGTPHANPCKDSADPLPRSCGGHRYIADDELTYPGVCVDGRAANVCPRGPEVRTFRAREKVEIRLALGGERSWDFDWTPFHVLPDAQTKDDCKNGGWASYGFRSQGACVQFVNTGVDARAG